MSQTEARAIWNCNCERTEGPLWLSDAGTLLLCDPEGGRILHYNPSSGDNGSFDVGGRPTFVFPTTDGQLVFGTGREVRLIRADGAIVKESPIDTSPRNRTGEATVDGNGRLWLALHDKDGTRDGGGLYRYFDERMIPTLFDMAVPGGPAMSADNRTLYHADAGSRVVRRFVVSPSAALSNGEDWLRFDEADGRPRALTLDSEECLWVAMADTSEVRRYSPDGDLLLTVDLGDAQPTGLVFGGKDMRTLFITTNGALMAAEAPAAGRVTPALKLAHGMNLGLVDDDDH